MSGAEKKPKRRRKPEAIDSEAAMQRPTTLPEPGPRTKARLAEAADRQKARKPRLAVVNVAAEGQTLQVGAPHQDHAGWCNHLQEAFGTSSSAFAGVALTQLASLTATSRTADSIDIVEVNAMLAAVDGMAPANEAEAMLAVQMAGTHKLAMDMLKRVVAAQSREAVQEYGALATKLLRTYTTQIEALAKVRRGGAQEVRVEHVHVYEGGQAIVGSVSQGQGRGNPEKGGQPYGPNGTAALEYAPGSPLWCENQIGEALSMSGDEGA